MRFGDRKEGVQSRKWESLHSWGAVLEEDPSGEGLGEGTRASKVHPVPGGAQEWLVGETVQVSHCHPNGALPKTSRPTHNLNFYHKLQYSDVGIGTHVPVTTQSFRSNQTPYICFTCLLLQYRLVMFL